MTSKRNSWILPAIVFSQFAGTSLWFSGNAVIEDLKRQGVVGDHALGWITSAVQLGFITGTLFFAFFTIADRFSPRIVFFVCSVLGAAANLLTVPVGDGPTSLLALRFATGFFLAGIYPVGMKIAAGWYEKGLGRALGFLIGALVLGTAFPHLLKWTGRTAPWQAVILFTSGFALAGGLLMLLLVPDGPNLARGARFDPRALSVIFRPGALRSAAMGYFGHMWELYTLWAFVPVILSAYAVRHPDTAMDISLWTFAIIAAGSAGCIFGGFASLRFGSTRVARANLATSGIFCFISPLLFFLPEALFHAMMLLWGVAVVGDSPQFSAIVARTAPPHIVGSALTLVNCIGFAITIVSIQLVEYLSGLLDPAWLFTPLAAGPLLGMIALRRLPKPRSM